MPNNVTVTPDNVCQHVAVLKNQFANFNTKIDDIGFKVNHVYENMPEVLRKVNKHHEVFPSDQIKIAKIEPMCEEIIELKKINPANDNGDERREGRFKRMPWWQKLSVVIGAVAILFRPEIQDIVSFIVKSYLGIK